DDSIIDVENIFRRLRKFLGDRKAALASGSSARGEIFNVVLNASLEVRRAVVYATFIVALIFLPVLMLSGLQGCFFAPLALSYILAILASFLVALTVTPALSYLVFGKGVRRTEDPRLQRWLKAGYGRVLGFVARWPRAIIAVVLVLCILAAT